MGPLKLPSSVVSSADIARLARELSSLNDFFVGAKSRPAGTSLQPPRLTRMLDGLANENKANLLEAKDRNRLIEGLKVVRNKAPCMHISFAVEPSPKALEVILVWMRQNIHPQVLISTGLQPSIAAGCIVRSTNKMFDMSLRSALDKQKSYLTQLVRGAVDGTS